MRVRFGGLLVVSVMGSLFARGAEAASYQRIDGTIVDPILDRVGNVHSYSGPNLEPGIPRPPFYVDLGNANLTHADLRSADLSQFNIEDADLSGSNLSGASLREARFSRSILAGSLLEGASFYWGDFAFADFSNAVLDGADLSRASLWMADLSGASLLGAYYDANTTFPAGFDPVAAGMVTGPTVVNNGLAPPALTNVFNSPERQLIVNNAGCNALIEYPCTAPGSPTTVSGHALEVSLHENSSFFGTVGGLTARDRSHAEVMLTPQSGGVSASDEATVIATGYAGSPDCVDASASGDATLFVDGFCWDHVSASGRSAVVYAGGGYDGSDLYISDDAYVDYQGFIWGLWIADRGRATVRTEVLFWIGVGPDGVLEMEGGNHSDLIEFVVDGTLEMNGGTIGSSGVRVSGYAEIRGGEFRAEADSYWNGYGQVPGPWNFVAEGSGLIDLSGGQLRDIDGEEIYSVAPRLAARDLSRLRVFGGEFEVDGVAIPFGSVSSPGGVLAATLQTGESISTVFAHRGADCGGQPCTGRILVLAPGLDWDQDAVPNPFDNCAEEPNADQADVDTDGTGDVCFAPVDLDRDGIVDALDNCRVDANADQADADSDGVGDACEKDLIFWADKGLEGCTTPPKRLPYELVTNDLGNGDVIDRSAQPCDCFGIEYPVTPGTASVRFVHRTASGFVEEYCENVAPYALGLGPNQPICADGLDEDGLHELMVTPYDAPGCEAGGGNALASSIRRFEMATPEPGVAVMVGVGVLGLAGITRRRVRESTGRG